jgi:response regulator RpfG family c-di-GMP phosphodiesterase
VATQLAATQGRTLTVLLIEDNPGDVAWTTSLLKQKFLQSEVVHSSSLADGLSVLAQRRIDAVFIGVHPDGQRACTKECRALVRKANGKPVVAMMNQAEMEHAAAIRETGVHSIYCKYARWADVAGLPRWSLSRSRL